MISIYDLGPTSHPETNAWGTSPFVRTIVFILRYKNLPYEIVPIGMMDIERTARELGARPTVTSPTTKFTVPFMKDSSTGKVVSDSAFIAQYLDEAYPDTPTVVPQGSLHLQKLFQSNVYDSLAALNDVSLRPALISYFPKEIQELPMFSGPPPTTEQVREAFDKTKKAFEKIGQNLSGGEEGPFRRFIMGGDGPTFADLTLVALVYPLRFVYGEKSEEWKEVKAWANGWVGWETEQVLKIAGIST
ncbi:hypothetical protein V5O48_013305 [Marasmius crinis-equi]|uniref:GST N-terminal domain-containing protein n=1 Tax=Marasmius crinis-equi TaxID=585013 RepID=A0ABR3F0G0_9AGAR